MAKKKDMQTQLDALDQRTANMQYEQQVKQNKGGRIGAMIGGAAGSLIPIPVVGPAIGSTLGSTIGQFAGGGQVDAGQVLRSGAQGGVGGAVAGPLGSVMSGMAPAVAGAAPLLSNVGGQAISQGLMDKTVGTGAPTPPPVQQGGVQYKNAMFPNMDPMAAAEAERRKKGIR